MKEKTTAFITLGCIFSLFFYYKIYSTESANVAEVENVKSTEQVVQELVEKIAKKLESKNDDLFFNKYRLDRYYINEQG